MTEAEQKLEEIRLLSLRVDEIKAQNTAYSVKTEELEVEVKESESLFSKLTAEVATIKEEIKKLNSKKTTIEKDITKYEKDLAKAREGFSIATKGMNDANLIKDALQLEINDQRIALEGLNDSVEERTKVITANLDSLKAFEGELAIKESLLSKRERTLDLREQGIKI